MTRHGVKLSQTDVRTTENTLNQKRVLKLQKKNRQGLQQKRSETFGSVAPKVLRVGENHDNVVDRI